MVRLLKCQEDEARSNLHKDELTAFAVALLCHLFDIFESDLTVYEQMEIINFCMKWSKK